MTNRHDEEKTSREHEPREQSDPGRTPGKAEGDERAVEEALRHEQRNERNHAD